MLGLLRVPFDGHEVVNGVCRDSAGQDKLLVIEAAPGPCPVRRARYVWTHDPILPTISIICFTSYRPQGVRDSRIQTDTRIHTQKEHIAISHYPFRTRIVLEPLAHLPTVRRQHETVTDEVLVRGLVKESRREHGQRVEPPSCLAAHKSG